MGTTLGIFSLLKDLGLIRITLLVYLLSLFNIIPADGADVPQFIRDIIKNLPKNLPSKYDEIEDDNLPITIKIPKKDKPSVKMPRFLIGPLRYLARPEVRKNLKEKLDTHVFNKFEDDDDHFDPKKHYYDKNNKKANRDHRLVKDLFREIKKNEKNKEK